MKAKGVVKLGAAGAIVTDREVRRFARALVGLVRWKRRRHRLSMETCAAWAGLALRTWRNVERRREYPNTLTLIRMMIAVNLTLAEGLTILEARKIKHLRRVEVRKNSASGGTNGGAEK